MKQDDMQAHIILLCFTLLLFADNCTFSQIEVLWQPHVKQVYKHHFPFISIFNFLN